MQKRTTDSRGNNGQARPCKRSGTERSFSPPNLVDCQTVITHPNLHSAVQRRPSDSYGNSGQGETLQAQPKRLTARPMESGWPQRNGTNPSLIHT
ncbi:hypothetical protein [Rossellomorea marisflavi]|uniref:hypothetical protein n=1 Tax=Rossellomorea marisflavi TaxID=189381 RepID=UPI003FA0C650